MSGIGIVDSKEALAELRKPVHKQTQAYISCGFKINNNIYLTVTWLNDKLPPLWNRFHIKC